MQFRIGDQPFGPTLLALAMVIVSTWPVSARDPRVETKAATQFDLAKGTDCAYIVLAKTEHKGVLRAAKDLQRDITKITGLTLNIVHALDEASGKCVVIGTADCGFWDNCWNNHNPAGKVTLGKNLPSGKGYPYIVFVKPALLAYENFHATSLGNVPAGWHTEPSGGTVQVVDNPDYDAAIRPSVFDLRTVPRYTPLELQSRKLQTTAHSTGAPTAELSFASTTTGDFVVQFRAKMGQAGRRSSFTLVDPKGNAVVTISFGEVGRIKSRDPNGDEVDIAGYQADRWYGITIDASLKTDQFSVCVGDDLLNTKLVEGLALDAATGSVEGIVLRHTDDQSGSWIVYDAVLAYERY